MFSSSSRYDPEVRQKQSNYAKAQPLEMKDGETASMLARIDEE